MNLLKLTERAAHALQCCRHLMADVGSENGQHELAAALDALQKHPPTTPPIVVGLFNQYMAHADGVIHAIGCTRTSSALDARDRLQRALFRLQASLDNLHGAAARRAGVSGNLRTASPLPTPTTARRA